MEPVDLPLPVVRRAQAPTDMSSLERDLRSRVDGEIRFDAGTRAAYSTDGSNCRQVPIGVVIRRTVAVPWGQHEPGRRVLQLRGGGGLEQVLQPSAFGGPGEPVLRGRAGHCPGRPEQATGRVRPAVRAPARHPSELHHQRVDRQQLVRFDGTGVRQGCRQCPPPGGPHLRRSADVGRADRRRRTGTADRCRGKAAGVVPGRLAALPD